MDVTNVSLAAGSCRIYVQDRGRPFGAFHAIYGGGGADGHRLQVDTLPMPNQPFGGTSRGLGSLPYQCVVLPPLRELPAVAGTQVTINDPTSLRNQRQPRHRLVAVSTCRPRVALPGARRHSWWAGHTGDYRLHMDYHAPCRISPSAGRLRGPDSSPRSPYGSASAGAVAHNWRPRR